MMKFLSILTICFLTLMSYGQSSNADFKQLPFINLASLDSMERLLPTMKDDSSKADLLGQLSYYFAFIQAEKSVNFGQMGVLLSRRLDYKKGIAYCNQSLGWGFWGVGDYSKALETAFIALRFYEEQKDMQGISGTYGLLANIYRDFGDYKRALANIKKGLGLSEGSGTIELIGYGIIGSIYELQNELDSADLYVSKAFELNKKISKTSWGWLYFVQGNIYRKKNQLDSAMHFYRMALPLVRYKDRVETYNGMAILYLETGKTDSSIFYASEVLQKWSFVSYQKGLLDATGILVDAYKKSNQRDSVIKYLELRVALNNRLYNQEKERDIQTMAFNEQMRQDELLREQEQNLNRLKMYALASAGFIFFITAILLWRNNKQKQRAKEKIENAYRQLKTAQQHLIQSEKMASLGELTAGIAHEIQNPLNFVNNFSEVNAELIDELNAELAIGNLQQAKEIGGNIKENEEKIIFHGKRADAIVKGMLQHSRANSGVKELTDINALVDEYLRLAYHGLRAKDKSFNATIQTDFDRGIGLINVIPQDIGRVVLNLITNAFYAVTEKKKQQPDFEPSVEVMTRKLNDTIEIRVKDNGNGIAPNIMDKIFQPFFTTKPTGKGTGLGLSLSYDIIKAHGGELKVETTEGENAEFIIQLPCN